MSNLRSAPLFLTPQVTRGLLGIDHPKRTAELAVEGRVNGADMPAHASKTSGGGKTMPSIGFIAVRRDGGLSPMMTASEFIKDTSPRAGFWRVRAKQTDKQTHEIAAIIPPSQQGRDGDLSSPDPVVVPATKLEADVSTETQHPPKPAAQKARRVAAPVPVTSKTAGTGAISVSELPVANELRVSQKGTNDAQLEKHGTRSADDRTEGQRADNAGNEKRPNLQDRAHGGLHGSVGSTDRTGVAAEVRAGAQAATDNGPANTERHNLKPTSTNWIANRFERIASAIAFLKSKCVLVQVVDRDELVKRYRVTGKRYPQYHDDVIDIALSLGWAG